MINSRSLDELDPLVAAKAREFMAQWVNRWVWNEPGAGKSSANFFTFNLPVD